MATTPHPPQADPKKTDDKSKANDAPKRSAKAAPQYPTLTPDNAWSLFYNGHRIAKQGDPPDKWISMARTPDGQPAIMGPMTPEMEATIKGGEYYHADDAALVNPPAAAPAAPPVNVDVPHVSAQGQLASCTMGNWQNEPTSYAYAWQRNGTPIASATSSDYTMGALDSGKQIGCIVTATNAAGSTAAPLSNTISG